MLRAYFDDSNIGQGDIYVLAGFVAAARTWHSFSDEWQQILEMRPRVSYFKYAEASGLGGQFEGITEELRNEKMRALMRLLEDHQVVGISASFPDEVFRGWFGRVGRPLNNPYFMLFYGAISRLVRYAQSIGHPGPISLVFDRQTEQERLVLDAWSDFTESAPPEVQLMLPHPPVFRNDKTEIPLQAADLHAGWLRALNTARHRNEPLPSPMWGQRGANIRREYNFMEWWHAAQIYERFLGRKPITYHWADERTEYSIPPRLHLPSWPP